MLNPASEKRLTAFLSDLDVVVRRHNLLPSEAEAAVLALVRSLATTYLQYEERDHPDGPDAEVAAVAEPRSARAGRRVT